MDLLLKKMTMINEIVRLFILLRDYTN